MRGAGVVVVLAALGCGRSEPDLVTSKGYFLCEFAVPPSPRTFSAPVRAHRFATADFNEDGRLDVAVVNAGGSVLVMLREQNDWSATPSVVWLPGELSDIAATDVDGNGHVDLVVLRSEQEVATILAGQGDGTFVEGASYPTAAYPTRIHVAELTGDARPDFVIHTGQLTGPGEGPWTSDMTVLRNDGTGVFTVAALTTGNREGSTVGDVDGDGFDDVIASETNTGPYQLCVHRGQASGFAAPICSYKNRNLPFIALADFNQDGRLDLASANDWDTTVVMFPGNGDGTFGAEASATAPYVVSTFTAADLNGDGAPDLVATSAESTFETWLNAGDGTFGRARSAPTGLRTYTTQLTATDVTADGHVDLLVFSHGETLSVLGTLPGDGAGRFSAATSHHFQGTPIAGDSGDIDADHKRDIVIGGHMATPPLVLYGAGDGLFTDDVLPVRGDYITIGDFTDDKRDDVLADTTVLVSGGDRTFTPVESGWQPGYYARVSAHINGDDLLDVVDAETATVGLGNGDGTFDVVEPFAATGTYYAIATGDLDGDDHVDLVAASQEDAVVLLGRGNGTFDSPLSLGIPGRVAVGRISSDDHLDIVVVSSGMLTVLLGQGDGTFVTGAQVAVPLASSALSLADMGGDERPDVLIADRGSVNDSVHYLHVLQTEGDGTFAEARALVVPGQPYQVLPGDYDGDGHSDVAVVSEHLPFRTFEKYGVVTSFPQRCTQVATE